MKRAVVIVTAILLLLGFTKTDPYDLKYPANFGGRFSIPADNPTTLEGVKLGRMLFYEEKLSVNNTISCASCHQQKLAFTDGRKLSQGVDGAFTKRNSMSLVNVLWVRNFFWDGRSEGLEAQCIVPLTDPHEMGQSLEASSGKLKQTAPYPSMFKEAFGSEKISGDNIRKAIAQFERTLISANSNYDKYLRGEYLPTESEANGFKLFSGRANCVHCHGSPKTFLELFHNNGLDSIQTDEGREGRFRVATLRNIAVTAPYMHDGRFNNLEQVVDHYSDGIRHSESLSPFINVNLKLSQQEKTDLIAFLNMLTDHEFINNPDFSDPAKSK